MQNFKRVSTLCTVFSALLVLAPLQAHALSKAAKWLVNEQIAEGCGNTGGRFLKSGVIEKDQNGDGQLDLIIDHNQLQCVSGAIGSRSGFCGAAKCSILYYLRKDKLLILEKEVLDVEP